MSQFMRSLGLLSFFLLCTSCYSTKEFVFDAEVVSMTKKDMPERSRLVKKGPVQATWCADDDVSSGTNRAYVDQVIQKAQRKKRADFILDARFYMQDGDCMILKGMAADIGRGGKPSGRRAGKSKRRGSRRGSKVARGR